MSDAHAGEIRDVSDTAIWVAHYRARESARPDAMFHDPLAALLTGDRGEAIARAFGPTSRYTAWSVVARTVIIDEYIQQAIAAGADAVVNLGAGLDTRPWRLQLPPTFQWVEADFPHMIEYKQQKLRDQKPNCLLQSVGVDLADPVARRALLASVVPGARKVLVLTEGVVPYLTETQVADLAADLRAQPRFSCWIVEYFSPQVYRYLKAVGRSAKLRNAPFQFFPLDWDAFFLRNGWQRKEIHYSGEIGRRFHRRPPLPWFARFMLRFASQETLQRVATSTGYMLLVPQNEVPPRQ